ncbi:ferritin-like protein [Streptomyces sp. NBC_00654]|uniref:ferritin-like domain-containing protein n=1 Tax=Streptomyces sp. NBC_00654 TaxID=2975799 RepID=UPI00225B09EB|nr:ferritin-like protein [Streptomyces sp. NBC_00654]MCX4964757.1 ferritin-like protein [Streptomyces sp. NBC_00654]
MTTTALNYESNRIAELMEVPTEAHDEQWLKESLQQAIMLELATLPPYLCGLWSIKDPGESADAFATIQEIVFDEMSHMGLVCNMLTTIGGTPRLADEKLVPKYPGSLPGGVRPELSVSLSGLTKQSLDMYSQIERPDEPIVEARESHTSIGAFYTAILEAFRNHQDLITGTRQVTRNMSAHGKGNDVVALTSFDDVEKAVTTIKEQGEGTAASPDNPFPGGPGELAHFYSFREIFHGRHLIQVSENPKKYEFQGAVIPMPQAFPMGTVPKGGWALGPLAVPDEVRRLLDTFNHHYSSMLRFIEQAWQAETPAAAAQLLNKAVGQMFQLQAPAQELMRIPLPDNSGSTYGPEFRYVEAEA